jgi:hypothetical protein
MPGHPHRRRIEERRQEQSHHELGIDRRRRQAGDCSRRDPGAEQEHGFRDPEPPGEREQRPDGGNEDGGQVILGQFEGTSIV